MYLLKSRTILKNAYDPLSSGIFFHFFYVGVEASNQKVRPPEILECQADSRGRFPLKLKHATHYVNSRIALVGDAAHRIHPMAGQGVNLGFGDASCLAQSIETSLKNGKDFGKFFSMKLLLTLIS